MWNHEERILIFALCLIGLLLITGSAAADEKQTEDDKGDLIGLGLCLSLIVVIFIIFIIAAVWVYRDAEKRGMNGTLWLIVVGLGNIIGIIIFIIVRKDHPVGSPPKGGDLPPELRPAYNPPPPYPPPRAPNPPVKEERKKRKMEVK